MEHLLNAKSKGVVEKLLQHCFLHRMDIEKADYEGSAGALGIKPAEGLAMCREIAALLERVVYKSASQDSAEEIAAFLGDDMDQRLKGLLAKIIAKNLPTWRDAAVQQRLSLPRLADVNWRVDVKLASDQVSRMSVPTVLVDLAVEQQPEKHGEMPEMKDVTFELSKGA